MDVQQGLCHLLVKLVEIFDEKDEQELWADSLHWNSGRLAGVIQANLLSENFLRIPG
jgi:hypothetical protein